MFCFGFWGFCDVSMDGAATKSTGAHAHMGLCRLVRVLGCACLCRLHARLAVYIAHMRALVLEFTRVSVCMRLREGAPARFCALVQKCAACLARVCRFVRSYQQWVCVLVGLRLQECIHTYVCARFCSAWPRLISGWNPRASGLRARAGVHACLDSELGAHVC